MSKEKLFQKVTEAARENSTATVFFHMAMAEATGMCPSDHKALDLILRKGGLTAGELGNETGLASASVTSLIDRLEARGYVKRVRGKRDRRRIKVEAVPERIDEINRQFTPLKRRVREKLSGLSTEQLEIVLEFLGTSSALLRSEAERLSNEKSEKAEKALLECG
jgi:DNA-binding MarR family transcriptional regulator